MRTSVGEVGRATKTSRLRVVEESPQPERQEMARECVEGLVRACVQRRAQLRRDLAAEDQRLNWLRRRLADQRGVGFIRVETIEREFGR